MLFGDDDGYALNGADQVFCLRDHGDGVGSGDGGFIVQEIALQPAADQLRAAYLKEEVAVAQRDGGGVLCILADFFYLVQRCARRYEAEGGPLIVFQVFPPQGQPEAVHADHGQAVVPDFKQGAGVYGPDLVSGDSEGGLADHRAEGLLLDLHGEFVLYLRQFGVVGGGEGKDVVRCVTAGDFCVHAGV